MMDSFNDKIVLITGGASGIGRAVGEELARLGAIVTLADLDAPLAEESAERIRAAGGRAEGAALDVTDAQAVSALVERTAERNGRLDLIFNNAGIAIGAEIHEYHLDDWYRVLDINLRGVIHGVHAAYPLMLRQGFGQIVNTASLAGLIPAVGEGPYAASKFGVVGLTLTLRAEGADLGVKANVVCPGFVDTPILYENTDFRHAEELGIRSREQVKDLLPVKSMPVEAAAREIVRGIEKNKAIIAPTPHAKVLWTLFRISPNLVVWFMRRSAREGRKRLAAASSGSERV
jgi:NAD(P)-dependent dehydrogenase (short-subunit alcohol dehydrogenase family)